MSTAPALGRLLAPRTYGREVLTLVGGTAAAQAIGLAAAPVLARQYSPASFGELALFVSASGVIATIATLRYEAAIVLPDGDADAWTLAMIAGLAACAVSFVIGIALTVASHVFGTAWKFDDLTLWLPLSALAGAVGALTSVGNAWLNRRRSYALMSTAKLGMGIAIAGSAIGLGALGVSFGLLVAQLVGGLLTAGVVGVWVFQTRPNNRHAALARVARAHSDFPRLLLPTALLDTLSTSLPVFLITAWFGAGLAGQYSLGWRVLTIPVGLCGVAVGQVFYQRFARAATQGGHHALRLLLRTWGVLLAVGAGPTLLMVFFGPRLFGMVFGQRWETAGRMAAILAPMLLAMLVSSPTSSSFLVLRLQKVSLWFGVAVLVYRPAALFVGLVTHDLLLSFVLWTVLEVVQIVLYNVIALVRVRRLPEAVGVLGREGVESL